MKIKEVIVVEGKSDTKRLKNFFDVDTIETHGLGISKETLLLIKEINEKRGVILLLDPDAPGEKIRNIINTHIPNLKNAFIYKEDARNRKKVGVECANKEVLEEALNNLISYEDNKNSILMSDLIELGLVGKIDSSFKRINIARKYHIGSPNAKTFLKRINMLNLTKDDLKY